MKLPFAILCSLLSLKAVARQDSLAADVRMQHPAYQRHSVTVGLNVGFLDWNRHDLALPPAFEQNNVSGFAPISARVEYGVSSKVSLAAIVGYDRFVDNFYQLHEGNNGTIRRNRANDTRIFGVGLVGYYHLGSIIKVKRLDPFVGIGAMLNNVRYSAFPEGDSTLTRTEHVITPYLKAGVRYYISDHFSLYADAGYDKQSMITVGFSCRFFSKKEQ